MNDTTIASLLAAYPWGESGGDGWKLWASGREDQSRGRLLVPAELHPVAPFSPSRPADSDLLAQIRAGDESALETLFRRLAGPLARFACRIGAPADDADQLVLDAFWALWQRRTALPDGISIESYLFRAVRNHVLNAARTDRREVSRRPFAEWTTSVAQDTSAGVNDGSDEEDDLHVRIRTAIHQLPEAQQTALFLRYTREFSLNDVAATMDVSLGAVKMLLQRATKSLRAQLTGLLDTLP